MSTNLVTIRELANPAKFNLGLEKPENGQRSKFPGCKEIIQPALGRDNRWKTNLDELAVSILQIPDLAQRKAKQEEVKGIREELEQLTGEDLGGKSKFWEDYFIEIDTKTPLDLSNAYDRIKYYVILASDTVAPSIRSTTDMTYINSKFYIAKQFEDVQDKISKKRRLNKAGAELEKLMDNPDKAILVGKYLDLPITNTTPPNNMYDTFSTYLEADDKLNSVDKFLRAVETDVEEINIKIIYSEALKYNVIRLKEGLYQRGNITLGKEPGSVLKFLNDPKNSGELLSIQEEIDFKKKFG